MEDAGRWTLLSRVQTGEGTVERTAWVLLRRYGVVMKRLIEREGPLPPWRDLLRYYHRLEARGEIRGGRFVAEASGNGVDMNALKDGLSKVDLKKLDGMKNQGVSN